MAAIGQLDHFLLSDQEHLRVKPCQRQKKRRDRANGFYSRYLTGSFGTLPLGATYAIGKFHRAVSTAHWPASIRHAAELPLRRFDPPDRRRARRLLSKIHDDEVRRWHFRALEECL